MATVEVLDVRQIPVRDEDVGGFFIDSPQVGTVHDVYALKIEGWYLPRSECPALRLVVPGIETTVVEMNVPRPDVTPDRPEATAGFRVWANALRLPLEFEMHLMAHHAGRTPVWLATVRGRREKLPSIDQPRFQPIILTSFGRTGGTWVTHLIGRHPEIVALRPFEYESRIATYWTDVFTALSEPRSYLQCLGADAGGEHWWLGEGSLGPQAAADADPEFTRWLGKENVEKLMLFCHGRIEEAYERVSKVENRPRSRFFVERSWPNPVTHLMLRSVFPGAREIVLVRDFRDMVASILAYNERRGVQYFGRHAWASDEEFVRSLKHPMNHIVNSWRQAKDHTYLLRYEDIVLHPQESLVPVLDYLGVDSEPGVIDQMIRVASADSSHARDVHQTSTSAEASIGRWQRDLSEPVQEACGEAFGEILAELGYEAGVTETGSRA